MGTRVDIRVMVVEDEETTRQLITEYIFARSELKLVGTASDGNEALNKMSQTDFDLVFMDINLPGLSGFGVMEKLEKSPYVIFTTGAAEHALDAFEIGALDYMVKPVTRERFNRSIDRAIQFFSKPEVPRFTRPGLFVAEKENHFLVPFTDIFYISSHENSCVIHGAERDYVTYRTMKEMEQKLPAEQFLRIYKQYIINIHNVVRIQSDHAGNYSVFLKDEDETQLPIGRTYISKVKEILG